MKIYLKKSCCVENTNSTENFFWNMLGSLSSSITSIIFSIVVARACSPVQSDAFSIAFAIAAQIWTVANFESGTLMVTDAKGKYSDNDYFSFKLVLLALSLIATITVIITAISSDKYDAYKSVIVFAFCAYRIAEAFSNYYYAVFQKNEHINIAGFSMFLRTVISIVAFTAVILLTNNLFFAVLTLSIVCVLWILLYEANFSRMYSRVAFELNAKTLLKLFYECLPLFLCSFLISYLINVPKYSIDSVLTQNVGIQTTCNAIFQPAAVINLLCLFVFKPMLTTLAKLFTNGENKKFVFLTLKFLLIIISFSLVALLAASVLGVPVLQLFYGKQYIKKEHITAILMVVAGGAFYALSQLLYNMITIIRCQHYMLIGYAVTFLIALMISDKLVLKYQIFGAAMVYLISMAILSMLFLVVFIIAFLRIRKVQLSGKRGDKDEDT